MVFRNSISMARHWLSENGCTYAFCLQQVGVLIYIFFKLHYVCIYNITHNVCGVKRKQQENAAMINHI